MRLRAFDVRTRAGIDANFFALIDKQRHVDGSAGLNLGGLTGIGRGITTDTRLAF